MSSRGVDGSQPSGRGYSVQESSFNKLGPTEEKAQAIFGRTLLEHSAEAQKIVCPRNFEAQGLKEKDRADVTSLESWADGIVDIREKKAFLAQEGWIKENKDSAVASKKGEVAARARDLFLGLGHIEEVDHYVPIASIQESRDREANTVLKYVRNKGINNLNGFRLKLFISALKAAPNPYQYEETLNQLEEKSTLLEAQEAYVKLIKETEGEITKAAMYPLRIDELDAYIEVLGSFAEYQSSVEVLQACKQEKLGRLSEVDQVLDSDLAEGGSLSFDDIGAHYTLSECKRVIPLLDDKSLPEHREFVGKLKEKVNAYNDLLKKVGEEPNNQTINKTLSLLEIRDYLELLQSEIDSSSAVEMLQNCLVEKETAFANLSHDIDINVSPEEPAMTPDQLGHQTLFGCYDLLDILTHYQLEIPECTEVNRKLIFSWIDEMSSQHSTEEEAHRGAEAQERRANETPPLRSDSSDITDMTAYTKEFFARKGVAFPIKDTEDNPAKESDCIAQANCFRELLINLNILPSDQFHIANDLASTRQLSRGMARFVHPDRNKNLSKDTAQVLLGVTVTILRNAEAVVRRNSKSE